LTQKQKRTQNRKGNGHRKEKDTERETDMKTDLEFTKLSEDPYGIIVSIA
jgi:hypothetical protein